MLYRLRRRVVCSEIVEGRWLCDKVVIREGRDVSAPWHYFPCLSWLDLNAETSSRTLRPHDPPPTPSPSPVDDDDDDDRPSSRAGAAGQLPPVKQRRRRPPTPAAAASVAPSVEDADDEVDNRRPASLPPLQPQSSTINPIRIILLYVA